MVGERAEDRRAKGGVVGVGSGRLRRREPARNVARSGSCAGVWSVTTSKWTPSASSRGTTSAALPTSATARARRDPGGPRAPPRSSATTSTQPSRRRRSARAGSTSTTSARPPFARHAEALRAAHPAEARGQHPAAGERAAEVRLRDSAERLVCEAEDSLRADVEPARPPSSARTSSGPRPRAGGTTPRPTRPGRPSPSR